MQNMAESAPQNSKLCPSIVKSLVLDKKNIFILR